MSDFAVSLAAIQQAVAAATSIAAELGDDLVRLRREADAVLTGSWSGAAATAFDRSWSTWDAGARAVVDALGRLTDLLAATGTAYGARDASSSELLARAAAR
jgi:ESAT-6 family protein